MNKKIKLISFLTLTGLVLISLSSCKKKFMDGINDNPNQPIAVTPMVILPAVEAAIAYAQGGDVSRYTSIFLQQVTGASRQAQSYNMYSFIAGDFDNLWKGNLYAGPMANLNDLIKESTDKGYTHYKGVAEVLMAYTLGMTTDLWGSVPYSDAFKGADQLQPVYDDQQTIYASIHSLIAAAKIDLAATNGGPLVPGSEDMMFGGDVTLWLKFANALNARFYIHESKLSPTTAATNALAAIAAGGFGSMTDDAQFNFAAGATTANPWYQFNDQRGDITFDGFLLDTMVALTDPRVDVYFDTAAQWIGLYYGDESSPVFYMTYFEQKFIEAEANQILGNSAAAQTAYAAAITESMDKMGVLPANYAAYLVANGTLTGTQQNKLDQIMMQKYIAMFLHPEAWSDFRRSNVPALTPVTGSAIPRRFMYPLSENSFNAPNVPAGANLFTPRLWWDL